MQKQYDELKQKHDFETQSLKQGYEELKARMDAIMSAFSNDAKTNAVKSIYLKTGVVETISEKEQKELSKKRVNAIKNLKLQEGEEIISVDDESLVMNEKK